MKRNESPSIAGAQSNSRRHKYTKVCDNRKHAIRGLWRRNGKFVARITVEDDAGRKAVKWVPLKAGSTAAAQEEFRTLLVERTEDRLRHIGRCPKFSDYVDFKHKLLTIGAEGDTKNREARRVDFNAELEAHLKPERKA